MSRPTVNKDDVTSANSGRIFPLFRGSKNNSPSPTKKSKITKEQTDSINSKSTVITKQQASSKSKLFGDIFKKNEKLAKHKSSTEVTPDVIEESSKVLHDLITQTPCECVLEPTPDKYDSSNESIVKQAGVKKLHLTKQDSFDLGPIEIDATCKTDDLVFPNSNVIQSKAGLWNRVANRFRSRKADTIPASMKSQEAKAFEMKRRSATFDPKHPFPSEVGERRFKDLNMADSFGISSKKVSQKAKLTKGTSADSALQDVDNHYKKRFMLAKIFNRPSSPRQMNKSEETRSRISKIGQSAMNEKIVEMPPCGQTTKQMVDPQQSRKVDSFFGRLRTNSDTNLLETIAKKRNIFKHGKQVLVGKKNGVKFSEKDECSNVGAGRDRRLIKQTISTEMLAFKDSVRERSYDVRDLNSLGNNFRAKSTPDIINDDFNFFDKEYNKLETFDFPHLSTHDIRLIDSCQPSISSIDDLSHLENQGSVSPKMPSHPPPPPPQFPIFPAPPPPLPPRNARPLPNMVLENSSCISEVHNPQKLSIEMESLIQLDRGSIPSIVSPSIPSEESTERDGVVPVSNKTNAIKADYRRASDVKVQNDKEWNTELQRISDSNYSRVSADNNLDGISAVCSAVPCQALPFIQIVQEEGIFSEKDIKVSSSNSFANDIEPSCDISEYEQLDLSDINPASNRECPSSNPTSGRKSVVRFLDNSNIKDGLEQEINNNFPVDVSFKPRHRMSAHNFTNKDGGEKQSSVFGPIRKLRRRTTTLVPEIQTGANMFGRKAQADVKKSAAKVLDLKKDTVTRLKHLRVVIESYDASESKNFFEQFYSHIFFLFYEGFSSVEASLGQRASKAHREELDFMLFIFEKILIFLPEMIHKRWQVHSIGRIMKKLLHPGNSLKLRREGLRLFVIWYQILMDNAPEDCHNMFCSLVWGGKLSSSSQDIDLDIFTIKTFQNTKASVPEISPLLPPQSGDKTPSNLTRYFLEALLYCMVSEVNKVEWTNKESRYFAFMFLFNKFKKFYLLQFFPDFDFNFSIYQPNLNLPEQRNLTLPGKSTLTNTMVVCQEIIVKWFFTYCNYLTRPRRSGRRATDSPSDADPISQGDDFQPTEIRSPADLGVPAVPDPSETGGPGSNNSTLSLGSSLGGGDKPGDVAAEQNDVAAEGEYFGGFVVDDPNVRLVKDMLYSSRENINIVHEVFRQAFLWSSNDDELNSARRAVLVYKDWFWCVKTRLEVPVFLEEVGNFQDQVEDENKQKSAHVGAGLQNVLKVFFTISSNAFLTFFDVAKSSGDQNHSFVLRLTQRLEKQVEICKRILNIYRYSVTNLHMDVQTWEQLLFVLLRVTSVVMSHDCPSSGPVPSLAKNLAEPLFKTVIVTWIKANTNFDVSVSLWQQFTMVLSSLTHWIDLIKEWAKVMDVMTRIFSKFVYGLNLNDLPLDRLTEQKVKRLKGTRGARSASRGKASLNHEKNNEAQKKEQDLNPAKDSSAFNATKAARQRSRSGDVSPLHSSNANVAMEASISDPSGKASNFLNLPADGVAGSPASIVRSSSDNSLMLALADRQKNSNSLQKEALNAMSGSDHSLPVLSQEFSSSDNVHVQSTKLVVDNDDETVTRTTLQKNIENPADQIQNDEAVEFFEEKSFRVEAHLAKMDDFSYASSRSGHDTESLGSVEVHRISKVPYISMLEQGNESMTGDRSDNEYLLASGEGDSAMFMEHNREDNEDKIHLASEEVIDDGDDDEDVADIVDDIVGTQCRDFELKKDVLQDIPVSFPEQPLSSLPIQDSDHQHLLSLQPNEDVTSSFDSSSQQLEHLQTHLQTPFVKVDKQGSTSGWNADLAGLLWCRLLGSLGNINNIEDPSIHLAALECLSEIVEVFICVRDNQSVTVDNQSSPPSPGIVPPILYVAPWLFDSLCLGSKYQRSAMLSLRVLCKVILRRHDVDIHREHLVRFYLCLHLGLLHSNEKATNILIRHCSPRFLSLAYPGFSLLFLDFIQAAESTLTLHNGSKEIPRVHAMALLGNLMTHVNYFNCKFTLLDPAFNDPTLKVEAGNIKETLVNVLLKQARSEPKGRSRCVSLSCLGMYLYEGLANGSVPEKSDEILSILLSSLNDDIFISKTAASTLVMLTDHMELLVEKGRKYIFKILEELVIITSNLTREVESNTSSSAKDVLQKAVGETLFTILEWCMKLPLQLLIKTLQQDELNTKKNFIPLLGRIFHVLQEVFFGVENTPPLEEVSSASTTSQDSNKEGSVFNTSSSSSARPSHVHASSLLLSPSSSSTSKIFTHEPHQSDSKSIRSGPDNSQSRRSLFAPEGSILNDSPTRTGADFFVVRLAASVVLHHLVNYLGYFPFSKDNVQLCSSAQEHFDHEFYHRERLETEASLLSHDLVGEDALWSDVLKASDVQFFLLNGQSLMSVMELPSVGNSSLVENNGLIASFTSDSSPWCRFIFRDISGKFSWDVTSLHHLPAPPVEDREVPLLHPSPPPSPVPCPPSFPLIVDAVTAASLAPSEPIRREKYKPSTFSQQFLNTFSLPLPTSMVSSFSFFSSTHLVTQKLSAQPWHSEDFLDSTLSYIGQVSPECLFDPSRQLNIPWGPPAQISLPVEDQLSQTIEQQCQEVKKYLQSQSSKNEFSRASAVGAASRSIPSRSQPEFLLFRQLFNSFGSFSWERRSHFDLVRKNERFLRELKHLDTQRCQETHKVAVLYVGPGQEDKMSILSNQEGSQKFNSFVKSLGCMVNLRTHQGFMGGLQSNGSTGECAPYYRTSTKEILFHVSTLMPGASDEDKLKKLRHLGNDEVHIIWSEHSRDYRHGIIPTDFGDVLVVIYPLESGLFRVQIKQKPGVPHFGPLFDEAIVSSEVLAGLVRTTAVNAGNALRTLKDHYQTHYESRYNQIMNIAKQYRSLTTFEDFSFEMIIPGYQKEFMNLAINESLGDQSAAPFQDSRTPKDAPSTLQRKLSTPKAKKHPNKKHNQS